MYGGNTRADKTGKKIKLRKQKAKQQYDKSARPLPELEIGQRVRIQPTGHNKQWKAGVCKVKVGPRSHLVTSDNKHTDATENFCVHHVNQQIPSLKQMKQLTTPISTLEHLNKLQRLHHSKADLQQPVNLLQDLQGAEVTFNHLPDTEPMS